MNQGSWVQGLRWLVASDAFRGTILSLIVVNAFALGLEATPDAAARYAPLLDWVFLTCQVVFVAELLLRWLAAGRRSCDARGTRSKNCYMWFTTCANPTMPTSTPCGMSGARRC